MRFLATDFNMGTITVSLNYTFQMSRYYSTRKVFYSQPDFQLHWTVLNNPDALIPQFNFSGPRHITWQAGISKLNWLSVAVFSRTSQETTNSSLSQSQDHIATDGQSISKSLCRAPSEAHDQMFVTLWQLRSCFSGAPSLMRERICLLYILLALTSVVFLGSESLLTHDHILLSQIW
jgi:hypothetical protein